MGFWFRSLNIIKQEFLLCPEFYLEICPEGGWSEASYRLCVFRRHTIERENCLFPLKGTGEVKIVVVSQIDSGACAWICVEQFLKRKLRNVPMEILVYARCRTFMMLRWIQLPKSTLKRWWNQKSIRPFATGNKDLNSEECTVTVWLPWAIMQSDEVLKGGCLYGERIRVLVSTGAFARMSVPGAALSEYRDIWCHLISGPEIAGYKEIPHG